jgi:hypothetical protein
LEPSLPKRPQVSALTTFLFPKKTARTEVITFTTANVARALLGAGQWKAVVSSGVTDQFQGISSAGSG